MIVSFTDYVPSPRFDNVAWTAARILEAALEDGPYSQIDSKNLSPVDSDPAHPQSRSFTTENATIGVGGWYKIQFVDLAGDTQDTEPIQYLMRLDAEYLPTLGQVGLVNRGRTVDALGNELGTFTADTRPTDEATRGLIVQAGEDVRTKIGGDIPSDLREKAQRVIAVRTAMLIELSYYSSEVATDRSPYKYFKELYEELLPELVAAIDAEEGGGDVDDPLSGVGMYPSWGNDGEDSTWMSRKL